MDVGIGLPNAVPGVQGDQLTEWARKADEAGFSTLGTIDRLTYPNYEPMIALGAAAAVTERIRLMSAIAIIPLRENASLFAKQAATIHHLSAGRMVVGASVGGREDDYEASGSDFNDRGKRFESMLEQIEKAWQGDEIGPHVDPPPALMIGGGVDAAYKRAARYGAGWIMGGGTPEMLADGREKTLAAWKQEGREGEPRIAALAYYGLGESGGEDAEKYLKHYYEWLGEVADQIASSAATDEDTVKGYQQAFEEAGCDELIWFPSSADPEQVELLAQAALSGD